MKLTDIVDESLINEGLGDSFKQRLAKARQPSEPQVRQEPTMDYQGAAPVSATAPQATSDWLPNPPPLNDNPDDIEPEAQAAPQTQQQRPAGRMNGLKNWWQSRQQNQSMNQAKAVTDKVADSVLKQWNQIAVSLDPNDIENYQQYMSAWFKNKWGDGADDVVSPLNKQIDQMVAQADPANNPTSIKSTVAQIVNTSRLERATKGKPSAIDPDIAAAKRKGHLTAIEKLAQDQALAGQQAYADDTTATAANAIGAQIPGLKPDAIGKAFSRKELNNLRWGGQKLDPSDPGTQNIMKMIQQQGAEIQGLEDEVDQIVQQLNKRPVAEHKNFGGAVWKQMKDGK